jgi:exopolyphosphatase/guanosine-5'-triphosphate,3'-diphosphate pyrophosphatase
MPDVCFAVADMGTNSFHMIIAKQGKKGNIKILDKERKVIRLGSHKGEELSFISEEETELAIKTLKRFKKLADSYGAVFRAVATSAVREAKNKSEFISKIKNDAGIKVEVLDGKDEAKLIYKGAEKALSFSDKNILCIDIGGGSTEFINVNKHKTIFVESIKIGAVRLSKHYFPDFMITKERVNHCKLYIKKLINEKLKDYADKRFDMIAGTSGTIEAIASIIQKYKHKKISKSINGFSFTRMELDFVSEKIMSAKTAAERLRIQGMESKRADIIPPGLLILKTAFDFFNLDSITVADYALREGVIFDMIEKESRVID